MSDYLENCLIWGDATKVLSTLPPGIVHLTFTSPPYYNARDYAFYETYSDYLDFLESVFKQVHRVTQEGRFLVVNTSPVITPRRSRNDSSHRHGIPFDLHTRLVSNGWDFIDDIVWVKPEPSSTRRNGGFFQHRKPLMYKPNPVTEYLMVYRKQCPRLLDWNIRQYRGEVLRQSLVEGEFETTNLWRIPPARNRHHPAVFPKTLCEKVIRYYSYVGDVVMDPFAGSGTLGLVATDLKRKFLLVERDGEYVDLIRSRLDQKDVQYNFTDQTKD